MSYPRIFNFKGTATGVDVSSVQSSFGLLCTLHRLEPGGARSRRTARTYDRRWNTGSAQSSGRILHHRLDPIPFKDDDPQDAADGVANCVQNILEQRGGLEFE